MDPDGICLRFLWLGRYARPVLWRDRDDDRRGRRRRTVFYPAVGAGHLGRCWSVLPELWDPESGNIAELLEVRLQPERGGDADVHGDHADDESAPASCAARTACAARSCGGTDSASSRTGVWSGVEQTQRHHGRRRTAGRWARGPTDGRSRVCPSAPSRVRPTRVRPSNSSEVAVARSRGIRAAGIRPSPQSGEPPRGNDGHRSGQPLRGIHAPTATSSASRHAARTDA